MNALCDAGVMGVVLSKKRVPPVALVLAVKVIHTHARTHTCTYHTHTHVPYITHTPSSPPVATPLVVKGTFTAYTHTTHTHKTHTHTHTHTLSFSFSLSLLICVYINIYLPLHGAL